MNIAFLWALLVGPALASTSDPGRGGCAFELEGIRYVVPVLSGAGAILTANRGEPSEATRTHPQVLSLTKPFDLFELARGGRPLSVFTLRDRATFSRPGAVSVLDLPIKFPGQDYAVPEELAQFEATIRQIIQFEHLVNHRAGPDYYAYLTIHQSRVEAGFTQRQPGWQTDGLPGSDRAARDEVDHSYVVADQLPDVYTSQRFHLHGFDTARDNLFSELDRQALPEFERPGEPYQVYLANAHVARRARTATEPVARTFLRLTFSRAQYNRTGSTHNPMLPYSWSDRPRDARELKAKYLPSANLEALPMVHSLDAVRGERLGLVSFGDADARVTAHVADLLRSKGRSVGFVASVRPTVGYRGGKPIESNLVRVTDTFVPRLPIAETALTDGAPTYLIFLPRDRDLIAGEVRRALADLTVEHEVDGLVVVDVGGRGLTSRFTQESLLREHRLADAVNGLERVAVPERTLIIVAPGYGLPSDAAASLLGVAKRYRPTPEQRERIEAQARTWAQIPPAPFYDEVSPQLWRQALNQRFGPQDFPPLNARDPLVDVRPEHQDLLILPLDHVRERSLRPLRGL